MPLKLEKPWKEVKEQMIEIVPALADMDIDYTGENDDDVISHVASKMNKSREDTKAWIESVSHTSSTAS